MSKWAAFMDKRAAKRARQVERARKNGSYHQRGQTQTRARRGQPV